MKSHRTKHKSSLKRFFEKIFSSKKYSKKKRKLENPLLSKENPLSKPLKKKKRKFSLSSLFKKKTKHKKHSLKKRSLETPIITNNITGTNNVTELPTKKPKRKTGFLNIFSKKKKKRKRKPAHTPFQPISISPTEKPTHIPENIKGNSFSRKIKRKFRKLKEKFNPISDLDSRKQKLNLNLLTFYSYTIISTILFLGSYIIAYIVYQLTVIITASTFGIDAVWYYFEVLFPIGNESPLWTAYSIIAITLSAPVVSLIIGLYLFFKVTEEQYMKPFKKIFYLWLSYHFLSQFFGAWTAGIITREGFGYVADWLYLSIMYKFIIALGMLFIMAFMGYLTTSTMLETARSKIRINQYNKYKFLFSQAFLPWFVGTAILFLVKIPNVMPQHEFAYAYEMIMISSVGAFIIPMFFNNFAKAKIIRVKLSQTQKVRNNIILVSLLLLFIAYRLILNSGLLFMIDISVNISSY